MDFFLVCRGVALNPALMAFPMFNAFYADDWNSASLVLRVTPAELACE